MRSQADCSIANENAAAAEGSGSSSRDLTVAATSGARRAGARRSGRTRIGKIARLPHEVREQLNRRLLDGEPGHQLLDWLNALPKTQEVLAAQFGGRPVSKQNLSEWKQGGHRDWQRAEEGRLRVGRLTEQAGRLAGSEKDSPLSERLAAVLLVELAGALDDVRDEALPSAERWERLRQMLREAAQMRREDNRAARLRIEQERWESESDRLKQETRDRADKKAKEELCAPYQAASRLPLLVEMFGGGKLGRKMAARLLEIQHDLDPGMLGGLGGSDGSDRSDRSSEVQRSQAQSNMVHPRKPSGAEETRRQDAGGPSQIKPDQGS